MYETENEFEHTFWPSLNPSSFANVESISTSGTSCSRRAPPLLLSEASVPIRDPIFRLLSMPVHPTYIDLDEGFAFCFEPGLAVDVDGWRWTNSTMTFCAA